MSSSFEPNDNEITTQDEQYNSKIEMKQEETQSDNPLINLLSSMCDVSKLMNSEGPIVKAVVLHCNGTMSEIDYDTTPKKYLVQDILGAYPTIIGEWEDMQVLLVRGQHESDDVPFNANKLRFPFNNEQFRGDILLYRVNSEGVPEDFTLAEYEAFAARAHEDEGKVWNNKPLDAMPTDADADANDADDTDDTDDADDADADMENIEDINIMEEEISAIVERQFEAKYGRKPNEEEKIMFSNVVMQTLFGAGAEEDDEDFHPEEDEVEEEVNDDDDEEEEEEVNDEEEEEVEEEEEEEEEEEDKDKNRGE